jgi:hypothetical protein
VRVALLVVAVTACGTPGTSLQGLVDAGGVGGPSDVSDAGDAGCIMPVAPITCDAGVGFQGCVDGGPPIVIGSGTCPPYPLPVAEVGLRYEIEVEAECGTPLHTWTTTAMMPAGLEFDVDGRITGTPAGPTTGYFVFTATATDQTGASGSGEFSIQVVPAGSITICTEPGGCPPLPICGVDAGP